MYIIYVYVSIYMHITSVYVYTYRHINTHICILYIHTYYSTYYVYKLCIGIIYV